AYQLAIGNEIPSILPHSAVGLLASFIYILRMSGSGYYDFPECAKPHVETSKILVYWFTTGLFLAFFAFLLKIGVAYSRGAFVLFYFVAPVGLLGVRKATKIALASAVSRGSLGRRNIVLVGDFDEVAALKTQDMLLFSGTADVNRFTLSRNEDPVERRLNDEQILNAVINFVRTKNCREVVLVLPWTDTDRIDFVRHSMKALPVAPRLLPDTRVRPLTLYSSASPQVLAIEVQRAPLSAAERLANRTIDL